MKKLPLFLLATITTIGLIYLHSSTSREFNLVLSGFTLDGTTVLKKVEVRPFKNYESDSVEYFQKSSITGGFRLQLNVKENYPIKLVFSKAGYSTLKMEHKPTVPKGENPDTKIQNKMEEPARLFHYYRYPTNQSKFIGSFNGQQLILFDSTSIKAPIDTVLFEDIDFFLKAKKEAFIEIPFKGDWYKVKFIKKGKLKVGYVLYERYISA